MSTNDQQLQAQQQAAQVQHLEHLASVNNAALEAIGAVITRTESAIIADMAKAIMLDLYMQAIGMGVE
ncbi:MAG: hypothetical protein KBB83_06705 [Alphaproteobacteria bacterium]|nr:hypothetical protein [Alphaproteobacteria bacterium]